MAAVSPRAGNSGGFTLIEVLVVLVVAGLALSAIAGVFGNGLLGAQASTEVATALTLANGEIATAGAVEPLRPSNRSGSFAGRFLWHLRITPYDDPQAHEAGAVDQPLPALRLYRVEVAVAWSEGTRRRQLTLSTLRLGPAPP
ncbi:MAG TPA: prepilin-type N-terminal cleavage/methylation domain-containing protein [Stellaceae bacterium]|nr:prepilin-type N-terminal cleavage/methylation domain-containing protein [Stellaceae bacterium]